MPDVRYELPHTRQRAAEIGRLADLDQQQFDGLADGLSDRTPATLPGVDTDAIKQVEPAFDVEAFRAIARETFAKVRESRSHQNAEQSADLLSPQMQHEMQDAISGDIASHRHHLLPFLWIKDAIIAAAEVVDGREQIDVRFSVSAAEEDVDDQTGQVLAGDGDEHSWAELWRFTRTPGTDTSASDERHEVTNVRADQWLVAHRGWLVTDISRLSGS